MRMRDRVQIAIVDGLRDRAAPKRPVICCPKCHGARTIPLPDGHWNTLLRLRALGEATPPQLVERDVSLGLVNNRIADLCAWGFVERTGKRGRAYLYRAVRR